MWAAAAEVDCEIASAFRLKPTCSGPGLGYGSGGWRNYALRLKLALCPRLVGAMPLLAAWLCLCGTEAAPAATCELAFAFRSESLEKGAMAGSRNLSTKASLCVSNTDSSAWRRCRQCVRFISLRSLESLRTHGSKHCKPSAQHQQFNFCMHSVGCC